MIVRKSHCKIQDKLTTWTVVLSIDPRLLHLHLPLSPCTKVSLFPRAVELGELNMNMLLILLISVGCLAAESKKWSKVLLTDAVNTGATCLDGSPGGFYLRKGDPKRWIVFHQGSGWCSSDQSCAERSTSNLGSSNGWGPTFERGQPAVRFRRVPWFRSLSL